MRKIEKIISAMIVFLIFTAFTACASMNGISNVSSGESTLPPEIKINELPSGEQYPDSDWIVLYENTLYDVDYVPGVGLETYKNVHRIYRVFRNEQAFINNNMYFDEKTTFESFSARTIKPDGSSMELSEKDIYHFTQERKNQEYTKKDHIIAYSLPSLKKGDLVEIKYKSVSRFFYFSDIYFVQEHTPKLYSRFEIKIPNFIFDAGYEFSYRTKNISIPEPVFKKGFGDTGDRSYVWENRNIPKFKPEPMMGSEVRYRGHVEMQLAYWNTWNGFARDIYEVTFKPVLDDMSTNDSQRIKSKVEDLTSGVSDTLEKTKILTRFVQTFGYSDTANYFGHAIKPNEIGLILDREYGDCKDHALVLTAMLREIGVKAYPVLTAAYDTSGVDPKFVTDIFNHVIVKVILEGGQTLLLDPTSRFTQFGKLPEMDEDTYILEIRPKNDEKEKKIKLEKTPVSSFSDNLIERKVSGSIEKGMSKYEVSMKFTGHAAEQGRYMLENADRISIEKIIRRDLLYYLYNAKIGDIKIENMNDTDAPLFLKYSLTFKLSENSGIPVVPVMFFNDPVYPNYVYSEDRTKPLIIPSVYSTLETYEMVFDPEKFTVSVPEKIEDNEFSEDDINSWKVTVKNISGRISLTAGFAQKGKKVETEKIPSLLKKVTGFSDLRRKMSLVSIIPYVEKPSPDVEIKDENKTDSTLEKAGEK